MDISAISTALCCDTVCEGFLVLCTAYSSSLCTTSAIAAASLTLNASLSSVSLVNLA